VYYALGDTRTAVAVAAADLCVFLVLALVLRGPFGHVGVGLAVTASSAVQMLLLWWRLGTKLPTLHTREILGSAARTLVAALAGVAAGASVAGFLRPAGAAFALRRAVPGLAGSLVFCAVFAAVAYLIGSPELHSLVSAIRRRRARS